MKTIKKRYYVLLIKKSNKVIISSTKELISTYIDVCVRTISRNLEQSSIYDTESFTIWEDVPVEKVKRGFALR